MGIEEIRKLKENADLPKEKKRYAIPRVSKKRQSQLDAEKKERGDNDTLKEQWFKRQRKTLTGVCQCGCGNRSSKNDDIYFRHSICHVFPKSIFESVMYHPLNYVERAFWGGDHTNMDEQGLDKWPNMADWDDIKEKFHVLAPLLTDSERATKFYSKLESLVYSK